MPRPAVTMRRKGITSSRFSGPPNDSSRMPSYGLSGARSDPAWGEVTGILRFRSRLCGNVDCSTGLRQNYSCGVACGRSGRDDGRVCCYWATQEKAMQDLQPIGVHEDGEHLLLTGADGERFQMPIDDALRAAIRRDRPRLGQLQIEVDGGLRPRDVQALIRAGSSADEVARRAGWTVEKVHRYEGPILAEREHVAGLAQRARLRSRTGLSSSTSAPTLSARVTERLKGRDVEVSDASWDSWRTEGGPWTVVLTFAAGGGQRQASWSFDLADRTVST